MRQAIANKLLAYLLPNNFALILILIAVRHLLTLLLHTMCEHMRFSHRCGTATAIPPDHVLTRIATGSA